MAVCCALASCTLDRRVVRGTEPPSESSAALPGGTNTDAALSGGADAQNTPPAGAAPGVPPDSSPAASPAAPDGSNQAKGESPLLGATRTVEITAAGSGMFGRIRSLPPGLDCTQPPCSATFPEGTQLRLQVFTDPMGGAGFAGWNGACSGLDDCSLSLTTDIILSARYEPANRAFVTSTLSSGNLGGLAGADARCSLLASTAGLGGEVRAYLSTSTVDALERLQGSRGWVRTDGKVLVDTPELLGTTALQHPLRTNEWGRDIGDVDGAFTGTEANGRSSLAGEHCQDWTTDTVGLGINGNPSFLGHHFGSFGSASCYQTFSIYCFEVGKNVRISPAPAAGRLVFATVAGLRGGLAAADAECQLRAGAAQRAGSFKALLAGVGTSPASRFDLTGLPWVRPDGVPVTATASELFQAERWDSSPSLTLDGGYELNGMVSGGSSLTDPGTSEDTCAGWTSTSGSIRQGYAGASDPANTFREEIFGADAPCSQQSFGFLCLQE
ncbi:MAG: hypothetical protein RL685_2649 [Pseudomonadota bacterium]|jgi:hypothetical protein